MTFEQVLKKLTDEDTLESRNVAEKLVTAKKVNTNCFFCGKEFITGEDYPKDFNGHPLIYFLKIGVKGRDWSKSPVRSDYKSSAGDGKTVCAMAGDLCPECRKKMDAFLKKKGLEPDDSKWTFYNKKY